MLTSCCCRRCGPWSSPLSKGSSHTPQTLYPLRLLRPIHPLHSFHPVPSAPLSRPLRPVHSIPFIPSVPSHPLCPLSFPLSPLSHPIPSPLPCQSSPSSTSNPLCPLHPLRPIPSRPLCPVRPLHPLFLICPLSSVFSIPSVPFMPSIPSTPSTHCLSADVATGSSRAVALTPLCVCLSLCFIGGFVCVYGAARRRRKQDARGSTVISVCLCLTQSHNVHSSSRLDTTSANNHTAAAWVPAGQEGTGSV